ncbi:MAG: MoxR family ATPase [Candidatus Omnitrophica bacterium]|nr:MoxR family ATPase [Candidatus Omnitrophota bacterium]
MNEKLEIFKNTLTQIKTEIAKVIIGQEDVVDKTLIVILTGNHALIEGVPGIAKTLLVRTLSQVLGCDFGRIQFTPDLMPADITGTNVFNIKNNEFNLVKGPVFTAFLLADEINRAPAKTQSALLQAMQERNVTIDCTTYNLSPYFTVFATQNPIEFEGTYPLPEAQKDRFMLKITMRTPTMEQELELAKRMVSNNAPEQVLASHAVKSILTQDMLAAFREALKAVLIREELVRYLVEIVRKTREHQGILIGAGPRATQSLILGSICFAAIQGRDFVIPDDIKVMAPSVLEHRLILRPEYEIEGLSINEVINEILQDVSVPR